MSDTGYKIAGGIVGCLLIVLILGAVSLFCGWLCQLIAAHFGFHQPLWVFALGWFLVSGLFNQARASKS